MKKELAERMKKENEYATAKALSPKQDLERNHNIIRMMWLLFLKKIK